GGHDAASGVRNLQHLERALHRAVFAEPPMERDEDALEAFALQVEELALGRVEWLRVHALRAQRLEHRTPGDERDLALGGRSAHEHRDAAEVVRHYARSPTMRTSRTSAMPVCAATVAWT